MRRTGLSESTVQLLTVFDLFDSSDGGYSLRDLRAAERFSRWLEGRDPVEAINAALSARRPLRAPAHLSELELTDREAEADQLPLGDDPMTFDEAWESGVMAWSSASVHDALKSFVKCSQMRPKDAGCLVNLAMALERVGEREQAKQVLRRATIVDPGRPEPWLDLAALSSGTERINHLKKALETDPDDQITEYELAEEFTASERYHEALPLWERLIAAVDTLQPSQRTRARKSLTLCKLALAADLDQTI
jgi:tetratricopeptide (TPR) repeat protein